jgi:hypothetical protein
MMVFLKAIAASPCGLYVLGLQRSGSPSVLNWILLQMWASLEDPKSISRKQKPAPSVAVVVEECIGVPEAAPINQAAWDKPGVMQAEIDQLEAKLCFS